MGVQELKSQKTGAQAIQSRQHAVRASSSTGPSWQCQGEIPGKALEEKAAVALGRDTLMLGAPLLPSTEECCGI